VRDPACASAWTAARRALASDRIDRIVLHPVAGPLLLAVLLFLVFQAVFSLGRGADGMDRGGHRPLGRGRGKPCPKAAAQPAGGRRHRRRGGVLVFLPQILILFFFILVLEESGYLPRAAFLLDRLMGGVGLSGAPSFRCCRVSPAPFPASWRRAPSQPARPAGDHHDRAADDLLGAAAGVCAADRRLHSAARVGGGLKLQGLVLFALYLAGIVGALAVAWVLKRLTAKAARCAR
jgi:ferrous iron transport protein B